MGEQVRLAGFDPAQPAPRSLCVSPKSFVFPLCPAHDKWIYCAQCPAKRRTMKTPVIVDPADKNRPCPLGDFLQVEIVAMMQLPATHVFTHRLGRFVADRRRETDKQLYQRVLRFSGSKRIAQEIESLLRITFAGSHSYSKQSSSSANSIPTHIPQNALQSLHAMNALPLRSDSDKSHHRHIARKESLDYFLHPPIERIMQKEIRKKGLITPPCGVPFSRLNQVAIRHCSRGLQPSFDVQEHPFAIRMMPHRPHQ